MPLPRSNHATPPPRPAGWVWRHLAPWLARLLSLGLILLMQGPAMLMQEVAWAKMLVSYTQEKGLKRGVVETFDGKHPCELCAKASELRKDSGPREPLDRPAPDMRLAWAEMLPIAAMNLPEFHGHELPVLESQWMNAVHGRTMDGPSPPPPERA